MKSEDMFFSEKGVDEAYKKIILRLKNVISFYDMYRPSPATTPGSALTDVPAPTHILDRWILARLNALIMFTTQAMDAYEIDRALAPIDEFLEDLSVWFLRRSRERLKDEHAASVSAAGGFAPNGAVHTFFFVLREFSKVIAPFMPFIAEEIYKKIGGDKTGETAGTGGTLESVHLETWPEPAVIDEQVLGDMAETRRTVGFALEARARAGIKVRQPLSRLVVKEEMLAGAGKNEYIQLILDEVNVKKVEFDPKIASAVELDTKITDELHEEGAVRDVVRAVQDLRKQSDLKPGELATLIVSTKKTGQDFIRKFEADISKTTSLREIVFEEVSDIGAAAAEEIEIGKHAYRFALKK